MATYSIKAPNGVTYTIDGPEGATDDEIHAEVLRQHPDAAADASAQAQALDGGSYDPVTGISDPQSPAGQPAPPSEPAPTLDNGQEVSPYIQSLNRGQYGDGRAAPTYDASTKTIPNEWGRRVYATLNPMFKGSSDEEIVAKAKELGYPLSMLEPLLRARHTHGLVNFAAAPELLNSDVPVTGGEAIANTLAANPVVTAVGEGANSALAGAPQAAETWLANDPDAVRAKYQAARNTNPNAAIVGELAGAGIGTAGAEAGAVRLLGKTPWAARASDVLFGGSSGAIANPDAPLMGGLEGAGANLLGGEFGRAGARFAPQRAYEPNLPDIQEVPLNPFARLSDKIERAGDKLMASVTSRGAYDTAGYHLSRAASGTPEEVIANIENRAAPVSGAQPTLAEVARDPGLAGFQRGLANNEPASLATISARGADNAIARTSATSDAFGTESPQSLQDYGSTVTRDTADATRAAVEGVGPVTDRMGTGAEARKAFTTAYDEAKGRTREAYSVDILKTPIKITIPRKVFANVRDAADEFYGDGGGEIPAKLQSIIGDLADPNATTRTLTNIDRRLADFAGEANMAGRRSEGAFADRIRGNLGEFVSTAAPKPYRDALANAKALRAEQGRIFETGDAPAAFANDRFGNPSVGDTTVPSRIIRPGATGGDTIDGMIAAVGPQKTEQFAREELRRALDDRLTSGTKLDDIASRFSEVGKRFPSLQRDLTAISEKSALEKQIAASPLAKVADPNVDPSSFVGNLLRRSDNGRQLQYLGTQARANPAATNGLRRALGDFITEAGAGNNFTASGAQIPSIIGTRKAIDTVIKRAGPILSSQQKIVLAGIRKELEGANFAASASRPSGSDTALNKTFSEILDMAPGGKAKSMLSFIYDKLGNGEQVRGLLRQAVLDPDFAADLLKRPTSQHWDSIRTKLKREVGGSDIAAAAVGAGAMNGRDSK